MPIYHMMGKIPAKRHTVFRKPDGDLYAEELVSTRGFSSTYSLVYHCHPPTLVKQISEPYSAQPKIAREKHLKHTSLEGFDIKPADDFLDSRKPALVNADLHISLAAPRSSMTDYFYKNSQADEIIFVHERYRTARRCFSRSSSAKVPRASVPATLRHSSKPLNENRNGEGICSKSVAIRFVFGTFFDLIIPK